jgi:lysophospholipid acyltransferase (LPLAT)-like uncharacterized protein
MVWPGGLNGTIANVSAATTSLPVPSAPSPTDRVFSFRQRLLLSLITGAGFLAIRLIAPTLKFSVSFEEGSPAGLDARPMILSFWHNCVFPAIYLWRNLRIRVMSSDSFDGEYTGRIIRKFGFVKVRGSSSRGAVRALLGLRKVLEQGWPVAFTIDGPRGPRYVAKPGPVWLARATGAPMVAFHIAVKDAWILKTWDGCMIPKPFSMALMRVSRQIVVPRQAGDADRESAHQALQASLDRVREFAEAHVQGVGTPAFPIW